MTAREWEKERRRRRRAWRTAGTVLLGLLSGSCGCQGVGDHFRKNVSNDAAATVLREPYRPRTVASPSQPAAPAKEGAIQQTGANDAILQIGATNIVPVGAKGAGGAVSSLASWDNLVSEQRDGISLEEVTAAPPVDKETGSAEKKWTAAQLPEEGKEGQRAKRASSKDESYKVDRTLPSPAEGMATPTIPSTKDAYPLSLAAALAQAGAENPIIAIAQQAVQSALGQQLQARVLLLPSVNVGSNYGQHTGPIQASYGAIRKVDRQILDYGLGTNTDAANSIKIPGLLINAPLADAIFLPRAALHVVANRRFLATATRNEIFLEVSTTYLTLMNAEAQLAIIRQSEKDFEEIARLTAIYAKRGQGRQGDAERAEADLLRLRYEEQHAQQEVAVASADLAQLLNLDPSTRLVTGDIPLQVVQFIDPKMPLPKLLEIAERNHPGILAAIAAIRASQVRVRQEKARPLLPSLWAGFSATEFGGGTDATALGNGAYNPHPSGGAFANLLPNLTAQGGHSIPKFGDFGGRIDIDVIAYWTLQNMGFGNLAHIRQRRAELGQAEAARLHVLNEVREQVSVAYNNSAQHFRSIAIQRDRVQQATDGFQNDLRRIRGGLGRPIEVLDNTKRLREAREDLLKAVIGFDRAQFQLFVALGQPPTLVVEDDKPPAAPPPLPEPPAEPAKLPPPEKLPLPNALPPNKK